MIDKHPIQHLVGDELVWFKCSCGRGEFTITQNYLMTGEPQIGVVEKHFECECGELYIWEFGDIRRRT